MISKRLKAQATALRDLGHSYKYIEKELGINRSTLSGWFKWRPFSPNQHTLDKIKNGPKVSAAKRTRERLERTSSARQDAKILLGTLSPRDILLLGIGLYMGEGSKSGDIVRFSNSDPRMVRLFIYWSKQALQVTNVHLRLRVHSYPDLNTAEIEKYWLQQTGLPKSCLTKTLIDTRQKTKEKSGKLPFGTVHITICAAGDSRYGVHLFRFIEGLMLAAYDTI